MIEGYPLTLLIFAIVGLTLYGVGACGEIYYKSKNKQDTEFESCQTVTIFTEDLTNSKQIDCDGNIKWETDNEGNFGLGDNGDLLELRDALQEKSAQ